MPYTSFSPSGKWEPWLDTKLIYKKLYPDLKKYDLKTLTETFMGLKSINEKAALYCDPKKIGFHNALFDAFCCYALTKRLSTKVNLQKFLYPFA
jgi:DNA polymerase III epsilon subunit-like protein